METIHSSSNHDNNNNDNTTTTTTTTTTNETVNDKGDCRSSANQDSPPTTTTLPANHTASLTTTPTTTATTTPISTTTSAIHGIGLWNSWTRNFSSPLLAMWDLLDNAFDAAEEEENHDHPENHHHPENHDHHPENHSHAQPCRRQRSRSIHIDPDHACPDPTTRGVVVRNSCVHRIPPLSEILTAYHSTKTAITKTTATAAVVAACSTSTTTSTTTVDTNHDNTTTYNNNNELPQPPTPRRFAHHHHRRRNCIGENGVGIKQGCATLSDLSFCLTRNQRELSLGMLALSLQTTTRIDLPSFTFDISEEEEEVNDDEDEDHHHSTQNDINKKKKKNKAGDLKERLFHELDKICTAHPNVAQVIAQYGSGHVRTGQEQLVAHYQVLMNPASHGQWGKDDYVFCLILHDLKHRQTQHLAQENALLRQNNAQHPYHAHGTRSSSSVSVNQPTITTTTTATATATSLLPSNNHATVVKRFLEQIKTELPLRYLHVNNDVLDVQVNRQVVPFSYWQRRLVELTRFTVFVNDKWPYQNCTTVWGASHCHHHDQQQEQQQQPAAASAAKKLTLQQQDECRHTHKLDLYLGFDVLRCVSETESKAPMLCYYSRRSGRLIKTVRDARGELRLTASSSNFCQGLTILVDDKDSYLPLNPTKQDFAFGERAQGEIHRDNIVAWVSAVTKFYYNYHFKMCDNKKTVLTERVKYWEEQAKFLVKQEATASSSAIKPFASSEFSSFHLLMWHLRSDLIVPRKTMGTKLVRGKDALMCLPEEPPPRPPPAPSPAVAAPPVVHRLMSPNGSASKNASAIAHNIAVSGLQKRTDGAAVLESQKRKESTPEKNGRVAVFTSSQSPRQRIASPLEDPTNAKAPNIAPNLRKRGRNENDTSRQGTESKQLKVAGAVAEDNKQEILTRLHLSGDDEDEHIKSAASLTGTPARKKTKEGISDPFEVATASESRSPVEILESKFKTVKNALRENNKHMSALNRERESLKSQNDHLRNKLNRRRSEIKSLQDEIEFLKLEVECHKSRADHLEKQVEFLSKKCEKDSERSSEYRSGYRQSAPSDSSDDRRKHDPEPSAHRQDRRASGTNRHAIVKAPSNEYSTDDSDDSVFFVGVKQEDDDDYNDDEVQAHGDARQAAAIPMKYASSDPTTADV